jgi:hypothetical protein
VEGYYDTRRLTWLWSTQARVEGTVLQAAWHWDSYSSAPIYVTLPSAWGSVDGERIYSPHFVGGHHFGDSDR